MMLCCIGYRIASILASIIQYYIIRRYRYVVLISFYKICFSYDMQYYSAEHSGHTFMYLLQL